MKEYKGRIIKYCFLPNRKPFCTNACNHCYIRSLESLGERTEKNDSRIFSEMKGLVDAGYEVLPYTTEMLLMKNWKDILRTVGERKVYTNGKIIAENPDVIREMAEEGIKEMHITGNVPGYHENLGLVGAKTVDTAIDAALKSGIEPIVTLLITRDNFEHLGPMLDYYEPKGVAKVNLIRVVGNIECVIGREEKKDFLEKFHEIRSKKKISMNLDSSFGNCTKERTGADKPAFCGAGSDKVAIGLDDFVYPCSMLQYKKYRIGVFEDGKVLIGKDVENTELDKDECMAYQLLKL